ncbi:MAG: hypothetical protein ACOCQ2_02890 [Halanaerobiales bacterium]
MSTKSILVNCISNTYFNYSEEICFEFMGEFTPISVNCMILEADFIFGEIPCFIFDYILELEYYQQSSKRFRAFSGRGKIYLPENVVAIDSLDFPRIKSTDCSLKNIRICNYKIKFLFNAKFQIDLPEKKIIYLNIL